MWNENKFQRSGMFFEAVLTTVNSPRLPRTPPRFYHPKTTSKQQVFSKPPSKSPIKRRKNLSQPARIFL
jgi:hypothetical protein